jgi:hypothetical protein
MIGMQCYTEINGPPVYGVLGGCIQVGKGSVQIKHGQSYDSHVMNNMDGIIWTLIAIAGNDAVQQMKYVRKNRNRYEFVH